MLWHGQLCWALGEGGRIRQGGRNAWELRKLCQAMAEKNCAGGSCCWPCRRPVWGWHHCQAAAGPGSGLCPASALCLAVPREQNGCACGFCLCGLSYCGVVWGCTGSNPGQGPGCRGIRTGTGTGIQLCPTAVGAMAVKGAESRCCTRAARGWLLPSSSATTQCVLLLVWLLVTDRLG